MVTSKYTDSPYKNIPEELLNDYTVGGRIPVDSWWLDNRSALAEKTWDKKYVDTFKNRFTVEKIKSNQQGREPYPGSARLLLSAFEKYNIRNKRVAIIGSATPWIETILLNLGNKTVTIEYNVPDACCYDMESKSYDSFLEDGTQYDYIVTFSSIEHAGLGRYGDPLSPNEDLKAMRAMHNKLSDDGLLIWGAPVGKDVLYWNAHRVYGNIRLPLMFEGFDDIEWLGGEKKALVEGRDPGRQPVVVLQKEKL
jgi:hypothetical protein